MGSRRVENQAFRPYTAGSMRARLVPSRGLALAFVSMLAVLLGVVLLSQSRRVPLRTPFVPRPARGEPTTITLEGREGRRGVSLFRVALAATGARALAAEELWLFVSSETPRARLVSARLRVRGTDCSFAASGRDAIGIDEPIVLRRSPACPRFAPPSTGTGLDLEVGVEGTGALSLLGFAPLARAAPGEIQAPPLGARKAPLDVRGAFVVYPETAPRIVLLNYMWRVSPGIAWLVGAVGAAVGLALLGCLVFPTYPLRTGSSSPAPAAVWRAGSAAALLGGSLALLYAVLTPPLAGPDEPYHLLGYADLANDPALAEDAVRFMAETHLWRIRYRPEEAFRTIDVGRPHVAADPQLRPTEVAQRSAVLARLEQALAPHLRGLPAPRVVLALRLWNALLFALAVGVATALAASLVPEPMPQWLAFPFLFVPSLPFFAMHVSETAVLCSIYVLLAISLAVLFADGPGSHWAGAPLGLATGLMLAGGRSPWPLCALVAAALMGRAVLGSGAEGERRKALVFWVGFGVGASVFFALLDDAYRSMTDLYAHHFAVFIPSGLRAAGEWVLGRPAAVAGLAALGLGLEIAGGPLRARAAARLEGPSRPLVRGVAHGLVGLVLVSFVASLFVPFPHLPLEPSHPMTALERVVAVVGTMATTFRLTDPNFLLSSTFWVGFGWLDTMPGASFQAVLVVLVGLALGVLLLSLARRGLGRRLLWLAILAAGSTASLVLYTLSTQALPMALQGRYLIGSYLAVLAVVGTALTLEGTRPAWRAALLLALAGSIHGYCLSFMLRRYF